MSTDARGYVDARDNLDTYRRVVADLKAGRRLTAEPGPEPEDIPRVTPEERAEALGYASAVELAAEELYDQDGEA